MTMRLPLLDSPDGGSLGKSSHDITLSIPLSAGPATQENDCFQNIVQLLFPPTVYIRSMHTISTHIYRVYRMDLSNGYQLAVKFSPLPSVPLLRMERLSLETEARALTILARLGIPCIPQLYRYMPHYHSSSTAFLVRKHVNGTSLFDVQNQISPKDREDIDRQLGSLVKVVSQEISTAFGSLNKVAAGSGSPSWRESFLLFFEEVLRDAEDMMIHLPYDKIRREILRLSPALNEIRVPRLVILNVGRPSEVVLDPHSKKLSGILDLGSAIWGDVLMAEVFENPSDAFLTGFGPIASSGRQQAIRSMLYSSYRHVYQITEQYYRNSNSSSEMHARRRLTYLLESMALKDWV